MTDGVVKLDIDEVTPFAEIGLERPFPFVGQYPILSLVVTESGSINLGDVTTVGNLATPIRLGGPESVDPYESVPRISVAQTGGLNVPNSTDEGVFFLDTGSSVVISWEPSSRPYFQAELYDRGDVELRWQGLGNFGTTFDSAAGMEDESLGLAFPVLAETFNDEGVGQPFVDGGCVRFEVFPGLPTMEPTTSLAPSASFAPSLSTVPSSIPTLSMSELPSISMDTATPTSTPDPETASPTMEPSHTSCPMEMPEESTQPTPVPIPASLPVPVPVSLPAPVPVAVPTSRPISEPVPVPVPVALPFPATSKPVTTTTMAPFAAPPVGPVPTPSVAPVGLPSFNPVTWPPTVPPTTGPTSALAPRYVESTECSEYDANLGGSFRLPIDSSLGNLSALVDLPTPFPFLGVDPLDELIISESGAIFSSDFTTRISVAESFAITVSASESSGVFVDDRDNSYLITWEGADIAGMAMEFYFQTELYYNGDVEFRWIPSFTTSADAFVSAGLSSDLLGNYPVTGDSFDESGFGMPFISGGCRRFSAVQGVDAIDGAKTEEARSE